MVKLDRPQGAPMRSDPLQLDLSIKVPAFHLEACRPLKRMAASALRPESLQLFKARLPRCCSIWVRLSQLLLHPGFLVLLHEFFLHFSLGLHKCLNLALDKLIENCLLLDSSLAHLNFAIDQSWELAKICGEDLSVLIMIACDSRGAASREIFNPLVEHVHEGFDGAANAFELGARHFDALLLLFKLFLLFASLIYLLGAILVVPLKAVHHAIKDHLLDSVFSDHSLTLVDCWSQKLW
jgi:hypothetical protein